MTGSMVRLRRQLGTVFAWRSFEAYPIITGLAGGSAVRRAREYGVR